MVRFRYAGRLWEATLIDDGTLDTVIRVMPVAGDEPAWECRFDGEYAATFRDKSGAMTERGLRELGKEAADAYPYDV